MQTSYVIKFSPLFSLSQRPKKAFAYLMSVIFQGLTLVGTLTNKDLKPKKNWQTPIFRYVD